MPQCKYLLLFLAFMVLGACVDQSDPSASATGPGPESRTENPPPYGYRSGIIEFETVNPMSVVEETAYFADWGQLEIREEVYKSPLGEDAGQSRHQITLINGEGVFSFQVETNEGVKSALPREPNPINDYNAFLARQDEAAAKAYLEKNGIEKLPDEMHLGFSCQGFRKGNLSFWIHRGLVLRSTIRVGDFTVQRIAVRFVPDVTVDRNRFKFPEGVDPKKFKSVTELIKRGKNPQGAEKMKS